MRDEPEADWRPSASLEVLRLRASLLARLRDWFGDHDVMEVETPVLSAAAATDPSLGSMETCAGGLRRYLQTSPEFSMKRLLAAGAGDIYQICPVFRDGEQGRRHNPEFTMVEWYRLGLDMHGMMDEIESLLSMLSVGLRQPGPAARLSYRAVCRQYADLDPFVASGEAIRQRLDDAGVPVPEALETDRDGLLDLLLASVIEPALPADLPLFVFDFPASKAALATIRADDPPVAQRFELFLGGMELANGFFELRDAVEQGERFERDLQRRRAEGLPVVPVDRRLLAALEAGLPECSGVALGFDRLVMWLAGCDHISQALSFDAGRA
ncbi:MAG: EF-P lysine aminoacylase EpmA [Gammaproteobacteria bacterium]|jgi:lysyl-tRNA synthetase class 2